MVRLCRIAIVALAGYLAGNSIHSAQLCAQNRITGARPYVARERSAEPPAAPASLATGSPEQTPTRSRIIGARPFVPREQQTRVPVPASPDAEPTLPAASPAQPEAAPVPSTAPPQQPNAQSPRVLQQLRGRLIGIRARVPAEVRQPNSEQIASAQVAQPHRVPELTEVSRSKPARISLVLAGRQIPPQNAPGTASGQPQLQPQLQPPPQPSNAPAGQDNAARAAAPPATPADEIAQIENSRPNAPSILKDVLPRPISLLECVHTSIASRRVFNSFSGRVVVEQLTAYEPQVADQLVTGALSQFDPTLTALLAGNHIDRPPNSFFGPGISQNTRLDEGEFMTRMSKIWATGLTTSIGYEPSLAYLYFPLGNTSGFNPTHASDLVTRVNQPLLRGGNRNANLATLRVAQQRSVQSRVQVEAVMQSQLRSIEQVYWILHADHVRLRAVDEAILLAWRTRELVRLRYEAERAIYSDVARVTVALENLYQQRLEAEFRIRKSSYDLSQLVGLELGDAAVLVPIDAPERQPPEFNTEAIVANAVEGNLDLKRQRQEIAIRRQFVTATSNQRLPQLDLQALHRTSGLQDDLGSALHQMIGFEYNDYTLGLQLSQQLGYRQASSRYRAAQLEVARQGALLTALERQVGFDVLTLLSQLKQSYSSYESAVRQLAEAQRWVELAQTRYEDPPLRGESLLVLLLDYQTAVQAKVNAIEQVADRLAEFNGLLAAIGERRGNILEKWYIVVSSDEEPESDLVKPAAQATSPAPEAVPAPDALPAPAAAPGRS